MDFTDRLWGRIETGIFPAILKHPFLKTLGNGDLSEDCFRYYIAQDSLYLKDFGRGLALLGARSEGAEAFRMFCQHADVALAVEQDLHESFMKHWQVDTQSLEASPSCQLYVDYLWRVACQRPYAEALGAFLPCYWIYERVGKNLLEKGSPNALYQRWIDTYGGEAFEESVRGMLSLVNCSVATLTEEQQEDVARHFLVAARFEWMFWDAAWRREGWPIPLG